MIFGEHLSEHLEQKEIARLAMMQEDINRFIAGSVSNSPFPAKSRRMVQNNGNFILPGVHTTEADTHAFLANLADTCTHKYPVDIDEAGVAGATAITSDFMALRTLSGFHMNPMSIPLSSNAKLRSEAKLAGEFVTDRHKKIADELANAMFECRVPTNLHFRKAASTTFPLFTSDMDVKMRYLFDGLKNLPHILKLSQSGQLKQLLTDHGVAPFYYMGTRWQPDSVTCENHKFKSKPREVPSLAYALSGGDRGIRGDADKSVRIKGRLLPDFFGGRRRTVFGLSTSVNAILTAFWMGFREYYLNQYSFTWKHQGHQDMQRKLSTYSSFIGFDVKQHDQFVANWLVDHMFDRLSKRLHPDLVQFMRLCYQAPAFQPNVWVGHTGGFWNGDPFDVKHYDKQYGLPSGIAFNPDVGKYGMVFVYLCLLDDYFGDVLETGIPKILKGECARYALLNASDDTVIATDDPGFLTYCQDGFKTNDLSPYMILQQENGVAFLGGILTRDKFGDVTVVPNIVSAVVNFFAPERGVNDPYRSNWALGWLERQGYYLNAPLYSEVYFDIRDSARRFLKVNIDDLARTAFSAGSFADLTPLDRTVLDNPDSIYYKVDPRDLSPGVLDMIIGSVPAESYEADVCSWLGDVITIGDKDEII